MTALLDTSSVDMDIDCGDESMERAPARELNDEISKDLHIALGFKLAPFAMLPARIPKAQELRSEPEVGDGERCARKIAEVEGLTASRC